MEHVRPVRLFSGVSTTPTSPWSGQSRSLPWGEGARGRESPARRTTGSSRGGVSWWFLGSLVSAPTVRRVAGLPRRPDLSGNVLATSLYVGVGPSGWGWFRLRGALRGYVSHWTDLGLPTTTGVSPLSEGTPPDRTGPNHPTPRPRHAPDRTGPSHPKPRPQHAPGPNRAESPHTLSPTCPGVGVVTCIRNPRSNDYLPWCHTSVVCRRATYRR